MQLSNLITVGFQKHQTRNLVIVIRLWELEKPDFLRSLLLDSASLSSVYLGNKVSNMLGQDFGLVMYQYLVSKKTMRYTLVLQILYCKHRREKGESPQGRKHLFLSLMQLK